MLKWVLVRRKNLKGFVSYQIVIREVEAHRVYVEDIVESDTETDTDSIT